MEGQSGLSSVCCSPLFEGGANIVFEPAGRKEPWWNMDARARATDTKACAYSKCVRMSKNYYYYCCYLILIVAFEVKFRYSKDILNF